VVASSSCAGGLTLEQAATTSRSAAAAARARELRVERAALLASGKIDRWALRDPPRSG
jgi:hypothetical protein